MAFPQKQTLAIVSGMKQIVGRRVTYRELTGKMELQPEMRP
jgi:hypothetical protein